MSTTIINTKVYIKPGQQVRRFKLSSDDTTFESFKQSVLQAYEASPLKHTVGVEYETQFLYLDDEDDWISMNTEQEFRDALSFVGSNAIFRVKVVVLPKNRPEQQQHNQHQHPHHRPQHCRPQHPRCFRAPQPHHVINLGDLVESLFKPAAEQKKEEPQKKQAEQPEQKKPAEQSTQLLDNLLDELFQPNTSTTENNNNNNRTESVQDPLSGLLQGVFGSLNQQGTQQAVPFQAALNSLLQQTNNNNGPDLLSGLLNGLFNTAQQHVRQPEPQKTEEPKQEVVQKQPEQQPEVKVEEKAVEEVPIQQQEEELVIVDEPQVVQKEEPVQQEEQLQEQPEPQPFEQELQSLESMGFTNRALNVHLLKHHNGDLVKVVSQLLELSH